jgi:hypothetical protein
MARSRRLVENRVPRYGSRKHASGCHQQQFAGAAARAGRVPFAVCCDIPGADYGRHVSEVIAVDRLRNVGSSTPAAAIESWLWAATRLDESTTKVLTRAALRRLEPHQVELISGAVRAASAMSVFRIQRHEVYGPDRILVWIEPDASGKSEVFLMTRTGPDGTWQRDLDPRAFK